MNTRTTNQQPSLTVLLPTFNSDKTIKICLDSLSVSAYIKEILIADGGSTDNTIPIISTYKTPSIKICSRKDNNLYDGINNTIKDITGRYVLFMNSDDAASSDYIKKAIEILDSNSNFDFVFGNIQYGNTIKLARTPQINESMSKAVFQRMPFPHVSLIMKKSIFNKVGLFDTNFKISADLDFIIRLFKETTKGFYLNETAAICSPGGLSATKAQVWEAMAVATKHKRSKPIAFIIALFFSIYRKKLGNA